MGGWITIASEINQGTVFEFCVKVKYQQQTNFLNSFFTDRTEQMESVWNASFASIDLGPLK